MKLLITTSLLFSAFLVANSTIKINDNNRLADYYQTIADKENKLNEQICKDTNDCTYEIDAYEACLFSTSNNDVYCNRVFNLKGGVK